MLHKQNLIQFPCFLHFANAETKDSEKLIQTQAYLTPKSLFISTHPSAQKRYPSAGCGPGPVTSTGAQVGHRWLQCCP